MESHFKLELAVFSGDVQMSTRSGSSRRKPEQPGRVEMKKKQQEDEIDLVDDDDDDNELDENGVGSDDDVVELPEGTVVVNPEPVDDDKSSTPKSAKKRQKGAAMSMSAELNKLMSRILCTSCGKQINPNNPGAVRRHPWLKVITCKKCFKFLKSGPIQKDKDGLDEQCRWCGEGGRLYGCDYCHNAFCRPCIKRNLGRSEGAKLEEGGGKWKCYVCKPYKLKELVENCNKIMGVIEKEERKEKEKEERAREREAKKNKDLKEKEKEGKEKDEKDIDKRRDSKSSTPTRTTLRAPVPKTNVPVVIKDLDDKSKSKKNETIVIPDSSDKSDPSQKRPTIVVVEPKKPVIVPYKNQGQGRSLNTATSQVNNSASRSSPLLLSAMQNSALGDAYTRGLNQKPPLNDLAALSQAIYPYNVDTAVDKLIAASQALSLSLNGIKTDLAIARLTNINMFEARQTGGMTLKSTLHVFLNTIRELFNVQLKAVSNPQATASMARSNSQVMLNGKPIGSNLAAVQIKSSTPVKNEGKKDILNVSEIPIVVDDSPMKKSASEPVIIDDKSSVSKDSKDDSCLVLSQSDTDKNKKEINGVDSDSNMEVDSDEKANDIKSSKDSEPNETQIEDRIMKVTESSQKIAEQYQKLKEKVSQGEADDDDNIAAQLELLKEMADELTHELNDSEEESSDDGCGEEDEDGDDEEGDEEDADNEVEKDEADNNIDAEEEKDNKEENNCVRSKSPQRKSVEESSKLEKDTENCEPEISSQVGTSRSLRSSTESKNSESISKSPNKETGKKTVTKETVTKETEIDAKSPVKPEKDKKEASKLKFSEKDNKEDSSEKSPSKSRSEKTEAKSESRSSRSSSRRDDAVDTKDETSTSESQTSKSKKDDKKKDKKGKAKGAVTEIVTDEETDNEEKGGEGEDDLETDSDDSDNIEIDEDTRRRSTRKTRASKSSESQRGKAKGKADKSEKGTKSKKSGKKCDDDDTEEEYKSDSSNFDPELEKQIKGIEKSLASDGKNKKKKKGKDTPNDSEAEKQKDRKKDKKEQKKGGKSKGKGKASDDDMSSGTEEEDVEDDEEAEEEDEEDNLSPAQLRKLRAAREAARKEENEEDEENMEDDSDVSSDPEVSFPKIQSPKKKGKKKAAEEMSDDSDFQPTKKKRLRSKLLDAKLSDSETEEEKPKKGKKGGRRKRKVSSSEEEEEEDSETEDYSGDDKKKKGKGKKGKKGKGKKRRRIKKMSSSDEETKEPGEDDDIDDDDEDDEGQGGYLKRKKIRKVMKDKKLKSETKKAQKAEEARRKRIEERQKEFNSYVEVEGGESEDEVPEGVEREKKDKKEEGDTISKILGSPRKVPVTTKLILEMDKDKKKPLIEVEKTLIRKLKPHQVDAVRFIYNCTVESIDRLKKDDGSGAIVAHCMGLGKTLSVITYIHTMLRNHKLTNMSKCLVVCPLNTVLNWVNEFEIWLDDVDFEIEVFELSKYKQNSERAQVLREWHNCGAGVMILGYDMYRNLVQGSHCKNKKQKATFYETLADPGPDIVVCDEGHILKNDATSISKAMNKIKSRRRIVLTGTPLQNNLGEYHCMVNFVKPNLLGTRKEFGNRFVNPITNGQCTDSSPHDVKLMKRRAHILHEMLAGCVQRKDYSALTKFLPPKFEYVISVRLAPVQMDLYQKYLDLGNVASIASKGARLFKDYQALMRIWTHPWVLKLDEIRQENNRMNFSDSEDSFIDDEGETDGEDSFISDGSSTDGDVSPVDIDSDSDKGKKKTRSGRKTRSSRKKSSSSSDEESDKPKEEVVRKWTSRRRGNEEGAGASWMDIGVPENEFVNKEISSEWWAEYVKEEDQFKVELSGKLTLLFEILKMCEDIGDKVLVFSQSLLSLDIIEDFLQHIDEANQEASGEGGEGGEKKEGEGKEGEGKEGEGKEGEKKDEKAKKKGSGEEAGGSGSIAGGSKDEAGGSGDGSEKKEDKFAQYGKNWTKGADYFRMDGSTNAQNRKASQNMFNDEENYRARLFLISTKAGSLGINLVAANRVIIFDASWNPSHDIQSIFRVYRFGQVKPVYVYRFLAQGTMEEKIYERQVTKQSLSQRVIDEHQIERHFTSADLQELYKFQPDRLDDPNRKETLPMLPKDHMLAELMTNHKEWIVTFHEHDSLLENIVEQELTEEEKKAAWEDYEQEKKGLRVNPMMNMYQGNMNMGMNMMNQNMFQNLLMQGQHSLGPNGVLRIVQDLKARFPNLPPDMFQQRVQAVLRQILTQQIMQQSETQRRQLEQQQMTELQRLHQIKQQIQRQQQLLAQQRADLGGGAGAQQQLMNARGSNTNISGSYNQFYDKLKKDT